MNRKEFIDQMVKARKHLEKHTDELENGNPYNAAVHFQNAIHIIDTLINVIEGNKE